MSDILVVGAGAWGTALAVHCARLGRDVTLWARDAAPIAAARESRRLPAIPLPPAIRITDAMPPAAKAVLLAVPVQHLRSVLALALPPAPLVLCMKGLERETARFPAEIVEEMRSGAATAILTGPNFAAEIARGLPAAAVLASARPALRRDLTSLLSSREFRLYGSADPIGVQIGGAVKNVVAIAAGVAIGAGLGENARAALVTRGVAELARLNAALGGRPETASGLSGVGDLVLTCTGPASRNFRMGLALGRGVPPARALEDIGAAVEGVAAAPALLRRAGPVSAPITTAVAALLSGELDVAGAMNSLLDRPYAEE